MRLAVRHVTHFNYDTPIDYSVQRLHLTPQDFATQKTVSWKVDAPGAENALSYVDGFGNCVQLLTFANHAGQVDVIAEGIVECTDAGGVVKGLTEAAPKTVYLRQTDSTKPDASITEALSFTPGSRASILDQLHGLMAALHGRMQFTPGVTGAQTTAAQAFAQGQGVCQDYTHILIGTARAMGIPARYVTGYLVTGTGASSTASHAWAEALVPDLGWVGFDAANGICPDGRYVRVAAGIDASGVTPIRGTRRGGAQETMTVEVRVEIAQQ